LTETPTVSIDGKKTSLFSLLVHDGGQRFGSHQTDERFFGRS